MENERGRGTTRRDDAARRAFDAMLDAIRAWPASVDDDDLNVHVRAGKAMLASPAHDILEAARVVYCDHPLSFAIRPAIAMLFDHIDRAVKDCPPSER